MKRYLGWAMIGAVFVGIFVLGIALDGLGKALIAFGGGLAICVWLGVAATLTMSRPRK